MRPTASQCFVLGTNDLIKEMRGHASEGRFALVPALSTAVLAARAYGLDVIDGVYNDIKDEAGFRAECAQGRALGMDGKTLIHPGSGGDMQCGLLAVARRTITWAQKIDRRIRPAGECR